MNASDQITHYQHKLQYEIDAWDLYEAIQKGEPITIIDARSAEAYQKEHLPSAINFPHRNMTKETAEALLPSDLNMTYVTYCDGIGCNASTKGALKLAQL